MTKRLHGYEVLSEVYDSPRTRVSRARRAVDDATVLLKRPQPGQGAERLEAAYERELHYRTALHPEVTDIAVERQNGLPLLVVRDEGCQSLRQLLDSSGPPSLAIWLDIALGASRELKRLHALDVIHRDVHPGNLLWCPERREVRLIDFEMAIPAIHAPADPLEPQAVGGALPYMAPEMTGRMYAGPDLRSDLYSLGATLYELLLGIRPFTSTDPIELIHQHIAVEVVPPVHHDNDIPRVVSDVVMKLLSKSANARYQSARGLVYDLEQLGRGLAQSGRVPDLAIGRRDVADTYRPTAHIFGRDADRQRLMSSFKAAQSGRSRMHLICGSSGIGKTTLARLLREPAALAGGVYAEGKCDQFQRLQPYTAWVSALEGAVQQWLRRPKSQRRELRAGILRAVGGNGRLLTDLVPGLEALIGEQPAVAALGASEAQQRLRYVFASFLAEVARSGGPLVLFLDDLQWVDFASLELLDAIVRSDEAAPLLVVAAYRDNEVDASHPLAVTIGHLERDTPQVIGRTTLSNLKLQDVQALVAETFGVGKSRAQELATVVHAKTAGNPFFCHQLLKQLVDDRVLHFDEQEDGWRWDRDALSTVAVADNVVDLLIEKLHRLPGKTQSLLARMACLGNRSRVATIARVAETAESSVLQRLEPALQQQLVVRRQYDIRFSHDRIQQAAYALLDSKDKRLQHLRIARLLIRDEEDIGSSSVLLDAVEHFEHAESLLSDAAECQAVAALAAAAAKRAQAASAHDVALRYFRFALALYGEAAWASGGEAFASLYLEAVQSEFNNAHHDRVASMLATAESHVDSTLERVRLFELKMQFAIAGNDQNAAIDLAAQALTLLGIELADDDAGIAAQSAALQAALHWHPDAIAGLAALPEMEDAEAMAAMRIMVNAAGAAYVMRPALWERLTLQMVHTTMQHGSSPLAAFAYAFYGVLEASVYERIDVGYAFGLLGLETMERYGAEPLRAKLINLFDVFVRHWKAHLRDSLESLPRGLQSGIDYGDFEYGSYNAIQHGKHLVFCGEPLEDVLATQARSIKAIEKLRMGYHLDFARVWQQLARNLSGQADDVLTLKSDGYNADALIPRLLAEGSHFLVFNIYCSQTMLHYFLGAPEDALAVAERALPFRRNVPGMAELAEHNFFHSLSLLACLREGDAIGNRRRLRQVARNQRKLAFWARHAPMNFQHKFALVCAERLRRSRHPERAAMQYEAAIEGARAHYYLNDQALACECYGEYLVERGHGFLAAVALREALRLYRLWQAHAKVRALNQKHAALLGATAESHAWHDSVSDQGLVSLDVQSALRSSLLIANERDMQTLKKQLMAIVAENAGAQQGVLALREEGNWIIAARYNKEDGGVVDEDVALSASREIPKSFLQAAIRKGESIALHHAASSGGFEHDPYISEYAVQSALAVPIRHGDEVSGVLYLENRAAPAVFAPKGVRIIEILAAQAGVAIEKARLLAQLEERVGARTRELRDAKRQLEHANEDLRASEERFRLAMVGTSEGLFDWDVRTNALYLSPGWKHLLGYQDHELVNAFETWEELVDPEQREAVMDKTQSYLRSAADCFEVEYPMAHKDGSRVLIQSKAHIVRGADGEAVRVVGTHFDVTGERHAQAQVQHQAMHDSLTGLPNRALFNERLEEARARLASEGMPYVLHLLDLDRFKQRNDAFGHQVGDRILSVVAERIGRSLRSGDCVARLGGDEFAVIQHGVDDIAEAQQLARRLIAAINKPIQVEGVATDVGCSIGVRIVTDKALSTDKVIAQADAALYQSKARGGDVATLHCQETLQLRDRDRQLARELPVAIDTDQLFLEFQPELRLKDGRRSGVECLLRWQHPRYGVLKAADFVPAMETHGHSSRLMAWVVEAAAAQASAWMREAVAFGQISVNITTSDSLTAAMAEQLLRIIKATGVDPTCFKFELDGRVTANADLEQALSVLRRAGCTLCLQGFGTTAVAIADLPALGIRQVKLASALVQRVVTDPRSQQVVRAITEMARALDIEVIAPMIEQEAQREAITLCGCEWGQGLLIGAPSAASDHAEAVARLH